MRVITIRLLPGLPEGIELLTLEWKGAGIKFSSLVRMGKVFSNLPEDLGTMNLRHGLQMEDTSLSAQHKPASLESI